MMRLSDSTRLRNWLFAAILLALWIAFGLFMGHPIFQHNDTDQHTLQAIAWLHGHSNLAWNDPNIVANRSWLELARFNGQIYNSFPPTPTLIELPFAAIFGQNTPNTLVLLVFAWASALLTYKILKHYAKDTVLAWFGALVFSFGSQVLYTSLDATVHYQGHIFSLFFTLAAFWVVSQAQRPWQLMGAGLALALAVGCRPLQILLAPILWFLALQRFGWRAATIFCALGFAPIGAALGWYNWIRFGNPTEFGHNYLPLTTEEHRPQFGLQYLADNAYHIVLKLPAMSDSSGMLEFDGRGNAFWLTTPFALVAWGFFLTKRVSWQEKLTAGLCYLALQFTLLLHESNGWFQFGYRYLIDLLPLAIFFFGRTFRQVGYWMVPIAIWAIVINVYGVIWRSLH